MDVIPSIDVLQGNAVRLTGGQFNMLTKYGAPEEVLDALELGRGSRLHVVDLEASRNGRPVETEIVRRLAKRDLRLQVGGGIRSIDDAREWLDCGAERIVVGTAAAESPELFRQLIDTFGTHRVIPAVDVRDGIVRVEGWQRSATESLTDVLRRLESLGVAEILVTDISRDGAMRGPSFALYRQLRVMTSLRIIASGGVASVHDVVSLSRLDNISGCVIGKALLDRRFSLAEAKARVATPNAIPERIIPCLDVRDGRVVKGINFGNLRDSGDPVKCAVRYENEGADELMILDVSATDDGRRTALETVRGVAESIFIPLTVGGGVRSVDDFRGLLRAGADRVAINTAAIANPQLIADCAREFGVQAVVLSCDVKGREAIVRSGKQSTGLDAVEWCMRAEKLGAGEILLTSVDRDGTNAGFDLELLRAVSNSVKIGVIASGGAGRLEDFRDAIESGGARAVLAASLFHEQRMSIGALKQFLAREGIPVRCN
jgi:cyclase